MTWSVVSLGTVVTATSGDWVGVEPAGAAQNDLLIAFFTVRGSATFTLPSGWAIVGTQQTSGNTTVNGTGSIAGAVMAYIVRGGSAPSYTFTRTAGDLAYGRVIAYRSSISGSPIYRTGAGQTLAAAATACVFTGVTPSQYQTLIVRGLAGARNSTWSAIDAGNYPVTNVSGATDTTTAPTYGTWIERSDSGTTSGADGSMGLADILDIGIGATGNFTATASTSARHAHVYGVFSEPAETAATVAWDRSTAAGSNDIVIDTQDQRTYRGITGSGDQFFGMVKAAPSRSIGKKMFTFTYSATPAVGDTAGLSNSSFTNSGYVGSTANGFGIRNSGNINQNSSTLINIGALAAGVPVYVYVDLDLKQVWFNRASTWYPNDTTSAGTTYTVTGALFPTYTQEDYLGATKLTIDGTAAGAPSATGFSPWSGETIAAAGDNSAGVASSSVKGTGIIGGVGGNCTGLATTSIVGSTVPTTTDGVAASVGVATTTIVGAWNFAGVAASAALATTSGIGAWNFAGVGSTTALATTSIVGAWNYAAVAASAGVASSSVIGAWNYASVAASTGLATTSGVGAWNFAGIFVSLAEGVVLGIGASNFAGVYSSTAVAVTDGVGDAIAPAQDEGAMASAGVATVSGIATATSEAIYTVTAVAATSGIGVNVFSGVGSSNGVATAAATATANAAAVYASSGVAAVNGVGEDASAPVGAETFGVGGEEVVDLFIPPRVESISGRVTGRTT